jgi:hypothetical protein
MTERGKVPRHGGLSFDKEGVVSIWAGIVPLDAIPDDYFEERYGDDDIPLTKFYEDFGFGWFDHDFADANGSTKGPKSLERLIGECSFSSSYLKPAVAQARSLGIETTQQVNLLYDFAYDPQRSGISQSPYMQFIGSFPYDRDAPSAFEVNWDEE